MSRIKRIVSHLFHFQSLQESSSGTGQDIFEGNGLIDRIRSFAKLEDKWDFGSGKAVPKDVINKAIAIYSVINMMWGNDFKTNVAPTSEGGINLTLGMNDEFIDIIFHPDMTMDLLHEKGIGANYEVVDEMENISYSDIVSQVSYLCNLSGQFIVVPTIQQKSDLTVTDLEITKGLFQSLKKNVPWEPADLYQPI